MQITEALAWAGCDVTQFIRRAQWVHVRENPHSNWRERLKLRLPGGYQREQRRLWQFINEFDQWRLKPGPQREAMEQEFSSYLDYIKDPELRNPTHYFGVYGHKTELGADLDARSRAARPS